MDEEQVKRIQKFWRSKRIFTNKPTRGWKISASALTTKIVTFTFPIDVQTILDADNPKGFSEIMAYSASFKKPVLRWLPDKGWIGSSESVKKVVLKRAKQTVTVSENSVIVMGLGNYEEILLNLVKNGWAEKSALRAQPTYRKIDGIFYVNYPFVLDTIRDVFKKQIPASVLESVSRYDSYDFFLGLKRVPSVILKLKNPKWTYQIFGNGTVLFTGIKDPADRDKPRQLFKEFLTETVLNMGASPKITKPTKKAPYVKPQHVMALRYANGTFKEPPHGFYIRAGPNGRFYLYKWRKMEKNATTGEMLNRGPVHLTKKNAVMVAKGFAKAGAPVPNFTKKVFANLGIPIPEASETKTAPKMANRRAPSWNANKPGFYVRPGPGKQPYFFKIPKGLESGRKTVIKTYSDAGRNIPAKVREIFKIPSNFKINTQIKHVVELGLNKIVRIDNRQATRLTKAELLAIARNMNIPQANATMDPRQITALIYHKAGSPKTNRTYDAYDNKTKMFYRLAQNGRVTRMTNKGVQTHREWKTLPANEKSSIIRTIVSVNQRNEFNQIKNENKYDALRYLMSLKAPTKAASPSPAPAPVAPSPASSSASSSSNLELVFNYAARIGTNLGNVSRNTNVNKFMEIYKGLPLGKRGKPLKATVEAAYKKFIKTEKKLRENEAPKKRYMERIQVPNWMPASKVQAYKNLVTNLAFKKPKVKNANMRLAIKSWIDNEVPQSPPRAAHDIENAVTGIVTHVPAYVPKPRKTPPIPKKSPPPTKKKSPEKKKAVPNNESLKNAIINLGLNVKKEYTWSNLKKAGLNKKFKKNWIKNT